MAKKYTLPIGKGFYVNKTIFITPILYRCCFQDYMVKQKCFELIVIRNTMNIIQFVLKYVTVFFTANTFL